MNLEDYAKELEEKERENGSFEPQGISAKRMLSALGAVLLVICIVLAALYFADRKGGGRYGGRGGYRAAPSSYDSNPVHPDKRCRSGYRSKGGCL